jgi:hypothetical protein
VTQPWHHMGFRLALVFVGLFGIAFAIAGLLVGLPKPAVGGTCGPSTSSESAIVAFFDPGSIGAGPEPAAANATDRADWLAFVGECQATADGRVLGTFALLILSIGIATVGLALALGGSRKPRGADPQPPQPPPSPPQPGPTAHAGAAIVPPPTQPAESAPVGYPTMAAGPMRSG